MDTKKLLGLRIKELRKTKNITQEKLAEMVNVEPTTISNIECGRNYPNIATLEKILNILDCNFQDVFNFEHFDDKNVLARKLKNYIDNANESEIEFLYKTVVNLKQYKAKG